MMRKSFLLLTIVLLAAVVMQSLPIVAQEARNDDPIAYINARLTRSQIKSIDTYGLVAIKAPDQVFQFNIKDVSFNYNGRNDDNRLRIFGDNCIEIYADGRLEETTHRQSFVCRSRNAVHEAIAALNQLKQSYCNKDPKYKQLDKTLNTGDANLKYTTVNTAIAAINENLAYSAIIKVDASGIMTINGPDSVYRVNLAKAEFAFNNLSDDPRVRIYGDWCIDTYKNNEKDETLARESFTTHTRSGAYQSIKALYHIKFAFGGLDSSRINALHNVMETHSHNYSTIAEAIDYINDRLAVSIIMNIDNQGEATVNASDAIYRFNLKDCLFEEDRGNHSFFGFIKTLFSSDRNNNVLICSEKGLKKYIDGHYDESVEEESFSCQTDHDMKDVIKALGFIKSKLR